MERSDRVTRGNGFARDIEDLSTVRWERRRQVVRGGAVAAVVVALVTSLTIIVSMRSNDEGGLAASGASAPWWSVVDISDPSIFSGENRTFIRHVMPWQDRLVVFGGIEPSPGGPAVIDPVPEPPTTGDDEAGAYAWITDDDVNWERRRQDLPDWCSGFYEGVVALGDRLVVPCKIYGKGADNDGSRIAVATTSDLESWTVTPITEYGQWWFSMIGEGPDGTVVVQANEGGNPSNTRGFTMRTWKSSDLATWTPIDGETPETMVDGSAAAIRTFDDHIVVTGVFYDYEIAGPDGPTNITPAIWVSADGAPFVRTLLGSSDGSTTSSGAVMDMVSTESGYVAVGMAGDPASGVAWASPNLVDWSAVTVASGEPASDAGDAWSRSLMDVEVLPDGTLLAAGSGPGMNMVGEGWMSDDGGANWRTVGVGPDMLAVWNGRAVGMNRQFESGPTFWTWGGDRPAPGASVDLGAADDLAVGGVRWHAGHQLYLTRTDSTVMAFSQHSPQQGCRLEPAAGAEFPDPYLRDGAVFADPCHGAVFALDGTHLAGPSPRDLDQYAVEVRNGRITVDTTRLLTAP
jgi:nitrite reductase/ring-hydroxylating ferredoxin subunit